MSGSKRPCEGLTLARPHGLSYARPYVVGWRCDRHTPAAEAGRHEPEPGPGWPPGAYIHHLAPDPPTEH